MSEIQKDTTTEHYDDPFDALKEINDIDELRIREAAARLVHQEPEETDNHEATNWNLNTEPPKKGNFDRRRLVKFGVKVGVAAGLVGAAAGGITVATALNADDSTPSAPTFSEETTPYTVGVGDGYEKIVNTIPGIDTVDKRDAEAHVKTDPANIDALKDGLDPGDRIFIPVSINGAEPTEQK